jgi:hypothetical protein
MAILNKQDRIEASKRLVGIGDEIKTSEASLENAEQGKEQAEKEDEPNRKLLEERTLFINIYQDELKLLDGITRSELVESIMVDSAKRLKNNSFFPNDPQTPLPSLPDGVWKNFFPYARTHAVGKTNLEVFPATGARVEQDIINDINAKIAQIEAEIVPRRATGKTCEPGGFCSDTQYTDESSCTTNGETWTPGPDSYVTYTVITTYLSELKVLVQEWEDRLNAEKVIIPGAGEDFDPTRDSGNVTAIADIDNAISVIDGWQGTQDFDTTTTLPPGVDGSGCALFEAMVEGDFQQAKLQPTTLQLLKDELSARSSFAASRTSDLTNVYLGSVTQDLNTGSLTAKSGLYGERMLFIDMRLNVLKGTLSKLVNADRRIDIQENFIETAENAEEALSLAMTAVKTITPGLGTGYINVKDASGFSNGDRVYLVADDQEELSGSIEDIIFVQKYYRVKITFTIPKKYTLANNTRLYKLL